jgi:RND family efflux transporter MFP subunit
MTSPNQTTDRAASAPADETAAAAHAGHRLGKAGMVAGLLVVLGALFGLMPRWHHRATLRAETLELATPTVTVVSPTAAKSGTSLLLPAEVRPFLEAPIYARASGYLKRWFVDIGAQVKEGDLLAEIDTPELNQELAQARAQLGQADAALALAKTTAARWAELVKSSSVSEQEAAEKQADLELKTANVDAARANVHRLEDLQSFESVRAPFAGTITARNTDVGQLISAASGRELFRLAQTGILRVYVRVPQTSARSIAPGQIAELNVREIPGRTFPAKVVRTSGAMSAESRTLLTELQVDNSRGELLAGTFAEVRFNETVNDSTLTLPANTLLFRAEGPQVGVVTSGGKVELRKVALGRDFGPTIEILSGVSSNEQVILNPADSLVSGGTVKMAEPQPAPTLVK